MAEKFDPYYRWLGIGPQEQPANHYRLLGIPLYESNADVIESAADQRMAHLRTFQSGKHGALSQKLLNEVAQAKVCLLDRQKKAAYDQTLRHQLTADEKEAVDAELIGLGEEDRRVGASRVSKSSKSAVQRKSKPPMAAFCLTGGAGFLLLIAIAVWMLWPAKPPAVPQGGSPLVASNAIPTPSPSQNPPGKSSSDVRGSVPATPTAHAAETSPPKPEPTPPSPPPTVSPTAQASSFPNAPPAAVAPFDADKAKLHQQAWAQYLGVPVEVTNSIGMKLVLIPPGEFQMGATAEEVEDFIRRYKVEEQHQPVCRSVSPLHRVRITKPFYLGVTEVTQAQFQCITGRNRSVFRAGGLHAAKVAGIDTQDFPADTIPWGTANEFCRQLLEQTSEHQSQRAYRLPTEAEWEYACRAGTTTRFFFGDTAAELEQFAWGGGPAQGMSHPVGQKTPSPWGLCDVYGNEFEWCSDFYADDYYQRSPFEDPPGPQSGDRHVLRGGCWWLWGEWCKSSARYARGNDVGWECGFRVACDVPFRVAQPSTTLADTVPPANPGDAVGSKPPGDAKASPDVPAANVPKRAVPDDAAQVKARRIVEETFQEQFRKAKTAAEKSALARRLLEQAAKTDDDTAGCYALLDAAEKKATEGLDVETVVEAIDQLAAAYQVEPAPRKLDALATIGKKSRTPAAHAAIAQQALAAIEQAVANDAFDVARQLARMAQSEAGRARDKELTLQARARLTDIEDVQKAYQRIEESRATLKTHPDDPGANLMVGRYLCFYLGQWNGGLSMLAKGSEPTLKVLAEADLKRPASPDEQAALGDQWYELSQKAPASLKRRVEQRAAHWYFEALPGLRSIARSKVESRLDKMSPDSGQPKQIVNRTDGSVLVLIPAGKFLAGGPRPEEGGAAPFPVTLPAYYIGLCEVTNAQFKRFIDATGSKQPDQSWAVESVWKGRDFAPAMADHPVLGVSWSAARDYRRWAGLRLPVELEWEKAARGTDGREYPWGNAFDDSRYHGRPIAERRITTSPVTSHAGGRSPYGLYHMVGNAAEWCEDAWEASAYTRYRAGDFARPVTDRHECVRRSFGNGYGLGPQQAARIMRRMPQWEGNTHYDGQGFRVAKSAGP
jgi:formylglycine-generating enzyme required for sulfatase activity